MKKIISALLMLTLVLASTFPLSSCVYFVDPESPTLPEGYQRYDNGSITFAYPKDWTFTLMDPEGSGNNIDVQVSFLDEEGFETSPEEFQEKLITLYDNMGMNVTDIVVTKESVNNIDNLLKVTQVTEMLGVTMKQTQFVVMDGKAVNTITVTEVEEDDSLPQMVFETLYIKQWDNVWPNLFK